MFHRQTCNPFSLIQMRHALSVRLTQPHSVSHGCITWRIPLNDRMAVHLESGIATAACEAHYVVLAVIYHDSGLIDGDVVRPHVEDDANFSLVLRVEKKQTEGRFHIVLNCRMSSFRLLPRAVEPETLFRRHEADLLRHGQHV